MIQKAVFPGRYLQGAGALAELPAQLATLGKRPLLIAGGTALDQLLPALSAALAEQGEPRVEAFGGECTAGEIERLAGLAESAASDVVVGIGGGKVMDTAKAVANARLVPCVIVPTIASTDAPTSAVSVLYDDHGRFDRYLFLPKNPDLVLVDTQVIAQAPVRFLVAGMGDALATWFEADSCRISHAPNQCGGLGTRSAYALARLCYDTILEFGPAARVACEAGVVTPGLTHVIEANTLLSGLGFESGGLATAHSVHNGLTLLAATHDYYHGEKVAIGVLAGLFVTDQPAEQIDEVYHFCDAVGLPTTLDDIGLEDVEDDDLMRVAERACDPQEPIHHESCAITPEVVFAAIKAADRYGHTRHGCH